MGSWELGGGCRMKGVAAGGAAQGPNRERVCGVSGGEQGQTGTVESLCDVPLGTSCTKSCSHPWGGQADRFNYNMWFSFDCNFAVPKPPSLIIFPVVLEVTLFLFICFH